MTDSSANLPPASVTDGPALSIEALSVRFGTRTVLDDITLRVTAGEIVCLLGPSGSGKSTLLRAVAGIERVSAGRIAIAGAEVDGPGGFVEPERRRLGMVFQDYALFPHLTVAENVAFGLARQDHALVQPLLERLGLARYARNYPHVLSGGEQQRLALARAMAPRPRILLMDEPFASLDTELRADVRQHTVAFLRETATTAVIVTHDPDEPRQMADRVVTLRGGRIVGPTVASETGAQARAARVAAVTAQPATFQPATSLPTVPSTR